MFNISRAWGCGVFVCILAATALAQAPAADEVVANQNRLAAGQLKDGVLSVQLEIRSGAWRPEAEDGPELFVQAFGEAGHAAQIPGPLLRMPEGTTVRVTVANKLKVKATVYGLNTRPGNSKDGIEIAAGESRELSFAAGAPGTYYYWARTTEPYKAGQNTVEQPLFADAHLNGAFIVDPAGTVASDRVFVINAMVAPADVLHKAFEVVTINGKTYPYTEGLQYTESERVRWRVINPSFGEHPMHLHGAFYQVLSLGNFESGTTYADDDRPWVVTQDLRAGGTMELEWTPGHVGRWLFHCHFQAHMSPERRVPMLAHSPEPGLSAAVVPAAEHHDHDMAPMNDMAGLVLMITVTATPSSAPAQTATAARHKVDLVIEPAAASGKSPTFSCSVREGKKIVASEDKAMGPTIVVTRGEPTEITVLNHLDRPTTIHWHGLELDSYYDGVIGGGSGDQMTPAIAPGASFAARFTPNRAGTFIYHTHAADPNQLSGGIYGALVVLEPGEIFDAEHDKVLVLGTRDTSFYATHLTLNGAEEPRPLVLQHGAKYRLRLINIAPNLPANFELGSKEHLVSWTPIAKDGAALPPGRMKTGDATLHLASGEVYDFEFQSNTSGEIPLRVENAVNKAALLGKIVVQ